MGWEQEISQAERHPQGLDQWERQNNQGTQDRNWFNNHLRHKE